MSDRPTYPELLKLFYKYSFPDQLGAAGSSLAQAIIYKANDLYFPADFKMSNVELSHLSGVDVSNVGRVRQRVCEICVIDGKWLFHYVGNDKRKAGKYIIDYRLPSLWRQDSVSLTSNSRQIDPLIDNDPNSTLLNTTSEAMSLVKLMQEKWPHPNPPSESRIQHMIDRYTLSVCVDAMHRTREDMGNGSWDSIYNYMTKVAVGLTPETPKKAMSDEDMAVLKMKRIIADYRSINPDTGIGKTGSTESAIINVMRPYAEWYDVIDNFGAIVGMEREEYEGLTNGGVR